MFRAEFTVLTADMTSAGFMLCSRHSAVPLFPMTDNGERQLLTFSPPPRAAPASPVNPLDAP